jgi:hypothetical protein
VIHVDQDALKADTGSASEEAVTSDTGQAVMEDADGAYVSAETSRRIACDASTVVMRHAPDGTVLDVGRKRRTIPPAIRRALTARDRHCQFPGCTARHCDAHHSHDFTALNRLLPHPVYAPQSWVCVLNPDEDTFKTVQSLLAEAYDRAVQRAKRMSATKSPERST